MTCAWPERDGLGTCEFFFVLHGAAEYEGHKVGRKETAKPCRSVDRVGQGKTVENPSEPCGSAHVGGTMFTAKRGMG